MVKHIVIYGNTRSHKLCDTALYKFLGCLWIFELFAYGYTLAGPDELRKIRVESMMRKSGKLNILSRTVSPLGKSDAKNLRRSYRIL
jgi:hypothetical protein